MKKRYGSGKRVKQSQELLSIANSISKLNADQLRGRDRRRHMAGKVKELGGKPVRNKKIPLPILSGMTKASKKKSATQLKEAKESGMLVGAMPKAKFCGEEERQSSLSFKSLGKEKGGTLHLSKQTLAKLRSQNSNVIRAN